MSKIVVARLLRLGKDGDNFSKKMIAQVERTNAKVDDDFVEEFNSNWKTSGRIYEINEKATKERDEKVYWASLSDEEKAEVKKQRAELASKQKIEKEAKDKRLALLSEATELKLEFAKNIPTEKLEAMVTEAKKPKK